MIKNGKRVFAKEDCPLCRKAAEQDHAAAQFNLAYMYQYGYGVNQNHSTAMEWCRKAVEQGHAYNHCNLGDMNEYG